MWTRCDRIQGDLDTVGCVRSLIRCFQEDSLLFGCCDEPNKMYFYAVISDIGKAICEDLHISPNEAFDLPDDVLLGEKAKDILEDLYRWAYNPSTFEQRNLPRKSG